MDDFEEMNNFFDNNVSDSEPDEDENADDRMLNKLIGKENEEVLKKRVKSRPQPKLNEATLTGPKGIQALRESFKNYKFDLKKDPYDNLAIMLKKYEHWAHVMFPKLKFEDVINRCELLGDKRAVKVYMMKTRLGMPLTEADFTSVRRRDEIIETENNEDDAIQMSTRDDRDDDENYYDPLESSHLNGMIVNISKTQTPLDLPSRVTAVSHDLEEAEYDLIESAEEDRRAALKEEQRRREDAELAMAHEIMDDFDMY